jgi:hypothetical protein
MARRTVIVSLGISVLSVGIAAQQPDTIIVGANVRVSRASGPYMEPVIAANPSAANLIVSAMGPSGRAPGVIERYWSDDGGLHWQSGRADAADTAPALSAGDVADVFDADGRAYEAEAPAGAASIRVVRGSTDGGRAWSAPVALPPGAGTWDREYLAVDRSTTAAPRRLYVFGLNGDAEVVAYSDDGGHSFRVGGRACSRMPHRNTIAEPLPMAVSARVLVVGCSWWGADGPSDTAGQTEVIGVAVSVDGGESFSAPYWITAARLPIPAQRLRVLRDGAVAADYSPATASFAVDGGHGPFAGRLYVVWRDWQTDKARLFVAWSNDTGRTWTHGRPVTTDGADPGQQMAVVSDSGVLGIAWYDSRNAAGRRGYDLYFTASRDGGETFLRAARVTTAMSWPLNATDVTLGGQSLGRVSDGVRWQLASTLAVRPTGGDYASMAADRDGVFHPVWLDARAESRQIFTAQIRVVGRAAAFGGVESERRALPLCRAQLDDRLTIVMGSARLDTAVSMLVIPVQVENPSSDTFYGPIRVAVRDLTDHQQSFFQWATGGSADRLIGHVWRGPTIDGAQARSAHGVVYEFDISDSSSVLQPGDVTGAQLLRIHMDPASGPTPVLSLVTSISGRIRPRSRQSQIAGQPSACSPGRDE